MPHAYVLFVILAPLLHRFCLDSAKFPYQAKRGCLDLRLLINVAGFFLTSTQPRYQNWRLLPSLSPILTPSTLSRFSHASLK
jgi:hypothetical protein